MISRYGGGAFPDVSPHRPNMGLDFSDVGSVVSIVGSFWRLLPKLAIWRTQLFPVMHMAPWGRSRIKSRNWETRDIENVIEY